MKWKIKNRKFFILYFSLLTFHFLLFTSHFSSLHASDPEKELQEIQKKLLKEKYRVKETIKKEQSILEELEEINKILGKKRSELKYYNNRLSETREKIGQLENEIASLSRKLETRKKYLGERLRTIYKQQHGDIASVLVSARDYQDLTKRIKYMSLLAHYDSKLMETYSSGLKELNIKMQHMEMLQKELELNKAAVKKKTDEAEQERSKKDKLLAAIRDKRNYYNKLIEELEESSERLRELIKKDEEKELSYISPGKGFMALKRRLPWPVKGEILAPFGQYKDPKFNIPTFRKGVEIKADRGDTVLSVAEGRVVYADWFKGYGLLLIVNHGDGYHTLYAHLSEIFNKTGDIIKERQAIGKSGESGLLNEPSLYFEIRHKGKPIDPLEWLKK